MKSCEIIYKDRNYSVLVYGASKEQIDGAQDIDRRYLKEIGWGGRTRPQEETSRHFFSERLGKEQVQDTARANTISPPDEGRGAEHAQGSETIWGRPDDGDRDAEDSKVTYSLKNYPL